MSDLNIDLTSMAVEESYNKVTSKLQNIAYGPVENVVAGALLAVRDFAIDNGLKMDEVNTAMKLAKWAHIDKFKCFHSTQDRFIENFQVHCRECEGADQAAVGTEG